MVSYIKPLSAEIAAPTTAATASNVSNAHDVRVVNSGSTARLVTISTSGHTDSASMTIAPNDTVVIPKSASDLVFGAHGDLKLTKVDKPRN